MNKSIKTILPLAALAGLALSANAGVISIDFSNGKGTASGDTVLSGGDSDAVNSVGQIFTGQVGAWNTGPLVNHTGGGPYTPNNYTTAQGPVFTINPNGATQNDINTFSSAGATPDPLRDDWYNLNTGSAYTGPVPWELTGLTANGIYNITFFSDRHFRGGNTVITTGGVGLGPKDAEGDANFTAVVADGTGKLAGTWDVINPGAWCTWSGLQFEQTGVVPEPSTTALLGLGGLALILRRRK